MSIWTRQELQDRIRPGLLAVEGNLRKKIIEIAEEGDPEQTFGLVEVSLRIRGFVSEEAKFIARSASWLAVAKRESEEWFDHIVAKL